MVTQVRALETRRGIVTAAAEVFLERGYAGTSLAEIADRARVTKGALYFHFASKAALANEVIGLQRETTAELVRDAGTFDGDRLELLRALTYRIARCVVDDPRLRAAMRLTAEQPWSDGDETTGIHAEWASVLARVAAEGQRRGEVDDELDAERIGRLLVGALTGLQTVSGVGGAFADLIERVDDLWFVVGRALAPR